MNINKLLIGLLLVSVLKVSAQNKIEYGVKGGASFSGFRSGETTLTSKIGFNFGGFAELKLTERFGLQPEILFTRCGGNINNRYSPSVITRLDYLHVPVQGKVYLSRWLSFDMGPQIGFLVGKKGELDDGISNNQNGPEIELNNVNQIDLSLVAGFGFKIKNKILIQTRYNFGLSKVFEDREYKNSLISLSLGYYF